MERLPAGGPHLVVARAHAATQDALEGLGLFGDGCRATLELPPEVRHLAPERVVGPRGKT